MMARWAGFAQTGVPQTAGAAAWQPVGGSGDIKQLAFLSLSADDNRSTSAMLGTEFKAAQCAVLNDGAAPV